MKYEAPYVPGIRRVRIGEIDRRSGAGDGYYYAINLEELSEEVALGNPNSEKQTFRTEWSDALLAIAFLRTGAYDEIDSDEDKVERIRHLALELFDLLRGVPFNEVAFEQSRYHEADTVGFTSQRLDASGAVGPTILYIPEPAVRDARLRTLHRDLLADRDYVVAVEMPRKKVLKRLRVLGYAIDDIAELDAKVEDDTKPLRRALAQIQSAQLAMTAMFDFAASSSHRQQVWGTVEPKADPQWWYGVIVPDPPSRQQVKNADAFAKNNLSVLAAHLSKTIAWMTGGEGWRNAAGEDTGTCWKYARERNDTAQQFLNKLRDDALLGELLDNHAILDHETLVAVVDLLARSFRAMTTSPAVYADLLGSEIMAMARVTAAETIVLEPSWTEGRPHALAQEINAFVPENELAEVETPLSKRLIELESIAGKVEDHGKGLARILLIDAMPGLFRTMVERADLKMAAEKKAQAAVFRTLVGAGDLPDKKAQALLDSVTKISKGDQSEARELLSSKGVLRDAKISLASNLAWGAFKAAVAVFALRETLVEKEKAPAVKQLEAIKGIIDVLKAAKGIAETLSDSPSLMWRMADHGQGMLSRINEVAGHPAFDRVSHFGSFIDLVACVMTHANKKGQRTQTQLEEEREEVIFKATEMLIAMLPKALASGAAAASLTLLVAQTLLFDRKLWAYYCDLQTLPGPGRYVRSIWNAIRKDKDFERVGSACPSWKQIESTLDTMGGAFPESIGEGRGDFWELVRPGSLEASDVLGLLKEQYGFDERAAAILVGDGPED